MNPERILVVNVGSTSFKFKLLDMAARCTLIKGKIDRVFNKDSVFFYKTAYGLSSHMLIDTCAGYPSCIQIMIETITDKKLGIVSGLDEITAIGFKTVHAGEVNGPVVISDELLDEMRKFSFAAPAHNPPYIDAISRFRSILPTIPMVAVFETDFHRTIPTYASVYPLPAHLREKYHLRKFGFHGASHSYAAWKLPQILGKVPGDSLRIISCHLGGSSSLCAIKDGRSIDTSMGFSPQSGLPMNNRCGDLDVFSVLYLMEQERLTPGSMSKILTTQSGLKGISGISGDVRDLEKDGSAAANLALESFAYHVKKYIGSYLAVMNGADVISFSGGIGENDPLIRSMICRKLDYLGIMLDEEKNRMVEPSYGPLPENGVDISASGAKVAVYVLPTDEELMVAMQTMSVIRGAFSGNRQDI